MKVNNPIKAPRRRSRLSRWLDSRRTSNVTPAKHRPRRTMLQTAGWAIDKLLAPIAPRFAAARMMSRYHLEFAQQRAEMLEAKGFSGSRRDDEYRSYRWSGVKADIDGILDDEISDLQERCEELARDNIIARSAIEGRKTNEVGVGILCQPMISPVSGKITERQAEELNADLKDFFQRWSAAGVDKSRLFTLPQFQKQVVEQVATYGEAFILFGDSRYFGPSSFAMQIIHPSRVETPPDKSSDPRVRLGIQYDQDDMVVGYWVRTTHPADSKVFEDKYDFYPRYDDKTGRMRMCHVFEASFAGQSRGIPWLAQVMNRCKDLDDYWEAELVNKQIEACFGLAVVGGRQSQSPMDAARAASGGETDSEGRRVRELGPGNINYFDEGAEVRTVDPQRPGATFAPFIEWSLRTIAAGLNYPYELLAKNFFRTTYSSGQLAMIDGRMGFRMRTQMLIDMWLCHVHYRLVWEAMMTGFAAIDILEYRMARHLFERHLWRGQNRGVLDPEKQNKGHKIGIEAEIESRTSILNGRGDTLEDFEQDCLNEGKKRIEREVKLAVYRKELEEAAGLDPGASMPEWSGPAKEPDSDEETETDDETEKETANAA